MGWSWYLWPSITMRSFVHGWRMQWWDVEDPAIPILWQLPHGFCCIERIEKEARFPRNILMPKGKKRSNKQGNTAVRRTGQKKEGSYATWADGAWRAAGIVAAFLHGYYSEFFRWPRALHTATSAILLTPWSFANRNIQMRSFRQCGMRPLGVHSRGATSQETFDQHCWDALTGRVGVLYTRGISQYDTVRVSGYMWVWGFYVLGAYWGISLGHCESVSIYVGISFQHRVSVCHSFPGRIVFLVGLLS